ncbi:hypothetical protein SUGI_1157310 [Cryptomeria japonica]|nr:hypothetical protein SUGI_1157310 [Cryptomeria japonica]
MVCLLNGVGKVNRWNLLPTGWKRLMRVRDCLGGFIGLERNRCHSSDIKMLINLDSCSPQLNPIIFTTANCKYHLEPELYNGPVSNHSAFKLSPSSLVRKKIKTPKPSLTKPLNLVNSTIMQEGSEGVGCPSRLNNSVPNPSSEIEGELVPDKELLFASPLALEKPPENNETVIFDGNCPLSGYAQPGLVNPSHDNISIPSSHKDDHNHELGRIEGEIPSGLIKGLETKKVVCGSQEPFPENPARAVEIINITERVACADELVNGHPEMLEGRDNMSPCHKDVSIGERKEDSINQAWEASNQDELGEGLGSEDEEVGEFRMEVLGIDQNEWGMVTPDCAKQCKRRGKKSLSELRNLDGSAEGQVKLTSMFDTGKGKYLPKEP